MKYAVDKIEESIATLENIDTKEKIEIEVINLPVVHEGDILVLEDGLYRIDNNLRDERRKLIREKLEKLKRKK